MLVYRALNDCDIMINPTRNGIFSKDVITKGIRNAVDDILNKQLEQDRNRLDPNFYTDTFKLLRDRFIPTNISYIKEIALKENLKDNNLLDNIFEEDENMFFYRNSVNLLLKKLSTINNKEGSWISFTNRINPLIDYYLNQSDTHSVAVMDSDIYEFSDYGLLAIDLSSNRAIYKNARLIDDIKYLSSGIRNDKPLILDSKDSTNEVFYHSYIPKDRILAILSPLQIDLLYNDALDYEFYDLSKDNQLKVYNYILDSLDRKISLIKDDYVKYTFEKAYVDQIPLSRLAYDKRELEELIETKRYIMGLFNELEDDYGMYKYYIKSRIKLPEDRSI